MPKSTVWDNFINFLKNVGNNYDVDFIEKFEKGKEVKYLNFLLNEVISLEKIYDSTFSFFLREFDFTNEEQKKLEDLLVREEKGDLLYLSK
jgi:hypothetical protein